MSMQLAYRVRCVARVGTRRIAESVEVCEDRAELPRVAAEMVAAILAEVPLYATIEWSAAELTRRESDAYLLGTGRPLLGVRRGYEYGREGTT